MNTTISALITAKGGVEAMAENSTTSVLGITTLQMGVFGGILVGLGVAALHNKFYKQNFRRCSHSSAEQDLFLSFQLSHTLSLVS